MAAAAASDISVVTSAYERLRSGCKAEPFPSYECRRLWLKSLLDLLNDNEKAICSALNDDFGYRSAHETRLTEIFTSAAEVKHCLRHLHRWMRPRRVATPWYMLPARARILSQPVGVVGIISPWNYPLFLSIPAAAGALAAGNRILLKPSELTPATSELLRALVAEYYAPDVFTVITGDAEIGKQLTRLPLDHLFFTGSTAVGREVSRAAAENLTPVTLELGGKSPAIVASGANLDRAARSIIVGKLLNSGQTCIAPDYCLVHSSSAQRFAYALLRHAQAMFGPGQTTIISPHHYDRLQSLLSGLNVLSAGDDDPAKRAMLLKIVIDPPLDSRLMREEIFGPILPILTYDALPQALDYINSNPRPLALYFMGTNSGERDLVLKSNVAGDVTVNDTLWHIAHPNLPFGGSGSSGHGAYHGEFSFRLFSHQKGIYYQSRLTAAPLLYPPFGGIARATLAFLRRFA